MLPEFLNSSRNLRKNREAVEGFRWHRSTPAAKRKEAILAGVRDHPISDSIVGEAQRVPSAHKTPLLCCKLAAGSNGALLGFGIDLAGETLALMDGATYVIGRFLWKPRRRLFFSFSSPAWLHQHSAPGGDAPGKRHLG